MLCTFSTYYRKLAYTQQRGTRVLQKKFSTPSYTNNFCILSLFCPEVTQDALLAVTVSLSTFLRNTAAQITQGLHQAIGHSQFLFMPFCTLNFLFVKTFYVLLIISILLSIFRITSKTAHTATKLRCILYRDAINGRVGAWSSSLLQRPMKCNNSDDDITEGGTS